jgi:cytochrome c oxidase cbb3-type subunit 3
MSNFWSAWIIVLTLANIFACYWLIRWTSAKRPGEAVHGDTTGHTWDGDLQEYNNPLPRWWLWLFYITMVFGLIYLAVYPGLGNFAGFLGWTQYGQYEAEVAAAQKKYDPIFEQFAAQEIVALSKNPQATEVGQRLFLTYCSTCHGSDARGAAGFPNLTDGDWLYGGDPQVIQTSILNGRSGVMPAMGAALGEEGVEEVAAYVMSLSGRQVDSALVSAGKAKFETLCVACHMADGKGNPAVGAPRLSDDIWLYGASPAAIQKSIREGRNGVMPAHKDFLGEDKVHVLAAYVYGLSNR